MKQRTRNDDHSRRIIELILELSTITAPDDAFDEDATRVLMAQRIVSRGTRSGEPLRSIDRLRIFELADDIGAQEGIERYEAIAEAFHRSIVLAATERAVVDAQIAIAEGRLDD